MAKSGYIKDVDKGWKQMLINLRALSKMDVDTGIHEGSITEKGASLAKIAAVQEFGMTITRKAGQGTYYKNIKRNGDFAKGGKFTKKSRSNFAGNYSYGESTITIPSRPFMRDYFDRDKAKIERFAMGQIKRVVMKQTDAETAFLRIGEFVQRGIQKNIRNGNWTPNAPSTIRQKKSARPLIDTGRMIQSIRPEVRKGGRKK